MQLDLEAHNFLPFIFTCTHEKNGCMVIIWLLTIQDNLWN
jgi:hypothetical protein